MEHVIPPPKLTRALQRHDVQGFLYDANAVVTAGVDADGTWITLRRVKANRTESHPLLDIENRFGERNCVLTGGTQEVISQS